MRFKSFLQFFSRAWPKRKPIGRNLTSSRNARLLVEMLERRELLAGNIPTLVTAGILPVDGSTTLTGAPVIQVQFSETMTSNVTNAANYILLGSGGNPISIDAVSFVQVGGPSNSAVQVSYNGGGALVVDSYTLFLRGDQMIDVDDGLAMAQPGQLIVANGGRNNVSVLGAPGDGSLGTLSTYNLPTVGGLAANPKAIAMGDIDGDGIADLGIVNTGTSSVGLYLGRAGGGFNLNADLTLSLAGAAAANSVVLTDLTKDGKLDLVTANAGTFNVTVFISTSAAGNLAFGAGNNVALDNAASIPVDLAAGDFDGDGNGDLAIAISNAATDLGGTTDLDYRIDILAGRGDGTFRAVAAVRVGDVVPSGLTSPSSVAAGLLSLDNRLELAVGGSNGVRLLLNSSSSGNINFAATPGVLGAANILALAIGTIDSGVNLGIVTATTTSTVEVYRNNSDNASLSFLPPTTIVVAAGTAGRVAVADFNGDGKADIVVSNGAIANGTINGRVSVLSNTTIGGSVANATNPGLITITSANHGLVTGQQVTISGALGNTSSNGTWTITNITGNITGAVGTGAANILITDSNHGLSTGESVTITGCSFVGANGTFIITRISSSLFRLNGTSTLVGNANDGVWSSNDRFTLNTSNATPGPAYTGGATWALTGTIAAANGPGGALPVTINSPNNRLATGQAVTIAGSAIAALNGNTYTITVVTGSVVTAVGTGLANITVNSPLHGLSTGDTITIAGNTFASVNNTFIITKTGNDNFTLNTTDTFVGTGTGGTWTSNDHFALNGSGGISGSGAGGTWTTATNFVGFTGSPYTVDDTPLGVVLGDTNQDGNTDVVTINSAGNDFTVLLGNGDGTLQLGTNIPLTPTITNGVTLADMNGDGFLDVIVINNNGNSSLTKVSILQGQVGGIYAAPIDFAVGAGMRNLSSVAVGDINGDNKVDIAFSDNNNSDNTVGFLINQLAALGDPIVAGSFAASVTVPSVSVGRTPNQVVLGDFNGDAKLDMAIAHNGGGGGGTRRGVTVRLGNGDGTFQSSKEYDSGRGMSSIVLGDFNRDGNLDFAAAETPGGFGTGKVWLNYGNGLGGFANGISTSTFVTTPGVIRAADFNGDGFLDVIVSSTSTSLTTGGVAVLLNQLGTGFGSAQVTNFLPGIGLTSLITTDINQDGFVDALVTGATRSGTISGATNAGPIVITSNNHGLTTGQRVAVAGVLGNTAANGTWTITVVSANTFSLNGSTGNAAYVNGPDTWTLLNNNVYVMLGQGTGNFGSAVPYLAGGVGGPANAPSYLAATPTTLIRVTTFTSGGKVVSTNLLANGDFEGTDLSGEAGNLLGWQSFDLNTSPGGSQGGWLAQKSTTSPLSGITVTSPTGKYRGMLDENNQIPYEGNNNPNAADSYAGSHTLYQDVTIPAAATAVTLSFTLYIDNTDAGAFSDTAANVSLDYRTSANNQQVRVDIMNPNGVALGIDAASGVLENLYLTNSTTSSNPPINITLQNIDLSAYVGQTIRLRIASANNQGRLIVGVDNAKLVAKFDDQTGPTLTGLNVSNPSYVSAGVPRTNDPTIVGTIFDNGGLANLSYVEFAPTNDGFGSPIDLKITQWDAAGNFSFKLPNSPSGLNTIGVQVVDKAGNATKRTFAFYMQSNSVSEWEAVGPQGIDVTGQNNVDFTAVSGRITATVPDLNDPLGNSYFVGSANGGIWKTPDGGRHWVSLTNAVTDAALNPIPAAIGGLAQSRSNPDVLYAATGVGDQELDSRPGVGVLKSTDAGRTWTLIGDSNVVLGGARSVKVVVDANDPDIAYVGVAADPTGQTGGVYKTDDGGATWVNVLDPANMTYLTDPTDPATQTTVGAGAPLDSVTDLIIDPANSNRLLVGLGSIGLVVPAAGTTGVWASANQGGSWRLIQGGDNAAIPNNILPNELDEGTTLGRVTVAIGQGRTGNEGYVYVLIGTPPGNNTPPNVDWGGYMGLYRTKDNMLNFTNVKLSQDMFPGPSVPDADNHDFQPIDLLRHDAANAGAMITDPTNPNVVYVGGSSRWGKLGDPPNHFLLRIDTGNMQDTSLGGHNFGNGSNDGDDVDKSARAAIQGGFYDPNNSTGTPADPYDVPEGVYWYDLVQHAASQNGQRNLLPPAITALALDSQSRLLVGTIGGIWRGVPYGFGYDFESGGSGILRQGGGGSGAFNPPAMLFTSINGNLQISDMTSVAIDPFNRGVYFTTQNDTGVAGSTSPLVWVSQGLTGPIVNGINLGIPNAGSILTSNPAPGTPAGTPVSLYRVWQYADQMALQPETSLDNGVSWSAINSTGISQNTPAGIFPAFAVNPNPIFQSDRYQTLLGFGANLVYSTETSGTVWDPISGVLSPGETISALSYAAGDPTGQTMFAGTTDGKFFYTRNKGSDNWPEQDTLLPVGIPGVKIKGIASDPDNVNEVFVMYGGTGTASHVFRGTINPITGAIVWQNISGTLPSVPAYAMAVDRQPGLGASIGKLYLATEVGVFYSLNDGNTWKRLGAGMPNVPVVDLKFDGTRASGSIATAVGAGGGNTIVITTTASHGRGSGDQVTITGVTGFGATNGSFTITVIDATRFSLNGTTATGTGTAGAWTVPGLQVLAAATLGRGVYTINTSPFSFISDQVIDENTTSDAIPFTINDPGLPAGSYTVSAVSDNQTLVRNGGIVLGGAGKDRTIQFTPVLNAYTPKNGVANLTVTLVGPNGFTYRQSFQVTVTFVNQLPTISVITPKVTLQDQVLPVGFIIGDVETAANQLVVVATSNNTTLVPNTPANLTLAGLGALRTLTVTPAAGLVGTAVITIKVTDGNLGVTTRAFDLLVTKVVTLPFDDDFNRANSIFLGPGWNVNAGTFTVAFGKASAVAGQAIGSLNQLVAADISLQADVNVGVGKDLGLIARYAGTGTTNYYMGRIVHTGGAFFAEIFKSVNGTLTKLASASVGFGDGTLRFEVASNSFKLYYGPIGGAQTLVTFANDSSLTAAGTAGFRTASGNVTADEFKSKAITLATPGLPFGDNFNTQTDGSQLNSNWVNKAGNFSVNNQAIVAIANPTTSIATVNGLNLTHSLAQALVNVVGAGNQAGVVVRHSGAGYFYAQIINTSTGFQANIMKFAGGILSKLAGVAIGSGAGYVRLEAVGSSLKLFFGATPGTMTQVAFAYSTSHASGAPGVRASAGRTIDDFTTNVITLDSFPLGSSDDFTTPIDGDQLERTWQYQAGNFRIAVAGTLQGTASVNLATANGAIPDALAETDYSVGAARGQAAGLVARYSATGMYLAQIGSTGTGFTANIFKFTPATGMVSLLGAAVTGVAGAGTARFEVAGPSLKLFLNDVLVAYASDTKFTTGVVGLLASSASTFTRFMADAIALTTPTLAFADDFSTPVNNDQLARNWDERKGNFSITGASDLKANATLNLATVHGITLANAAVQTDITVAAGQQGGVVSRFSTANGSYYFAQIVANAAGTTFTLNLLKVTSTSTTTLATTTVASGVGVLRLEAVGSNLKVFHGPIGGPMVLKLITYNTSLTTGLTGICTGKNVVFDNFALDQIVPTTPGLPFADDFSQPAPGNSNNQLARNWDERQGNFTDTGSSAVGTSTTNLATVHGVSLVNAAVEADITVAAGQQAALIARYQTNGNFYLARITANAAGTAFTADISKSVSGVFTTLNMAAATLPVSAGAGTLRFEASGTSLKLFFTPTGGAQTLLAYAFDTAFSLAGLTGIRASKNAVLASFSAAQIILDTPTLAFTDDFSSPTNVNQLGGTSPAAGARNWDEREGNFTDTGTAAIGNAATSLATVHGVSLADAVVQTDITLAAGQQAAVIARYQANGSYYLARITANAAGTAFTADISKSSGGIFATLKSVAAPSGAGTLRFEVSGTSLKVYFTPTGGAQTLLTYGFDTALAGAGLVGMRLSKNATVANFTVGQINLTNPALRFDETFSAPDGTFLSDYSTNWSERQGLFTIMNSALKASAATTAPSIATVNGPLANSATQETINLSIVGTHAAGLVARYNPINGNMYQGRITSVNGVITATIWKRVSGAWTMLATANPAGATGVGVVRFEVVAGNIKLFYGPTVATLSLTAYANDSALTTANLSGVYVGPGDSVDTFSLETIALTIPGLPFTDLFIGPNGTPLSRNWLESKGNYGVVGNVLVGNNTTLNLAIVNGLALPNVSVSADIIVGAAQQAAVIARFQANGSYYYGRISQASGVFTAVLFRYDAATDATTQLGTAVPVTAGTGLLRLAVAGNNLKLFFTPTSGTESLATYAYDATYLTGTVGIRSNKGAGIDSFSVAAVNLPTTQPPAFSDSFAVNPTAEQLSINWLERAGNFNVGTDAAVGQSSLNNVNNNLATVNGISAANVDLQADLSLTQANQFAGLVARFSGTLGHEYYYAATVTFVGPNNYKIEIIKVINGVKTSLGSTSVPAFTSNLHFLVSGNNLNVYLDNADSPVLAITDASIAAAGAVGMKTSAGGSVTSFTAI